jgi:ribosomal silencing factor RsfS
VSCNKNDCATNEKIRKIETDKIIETFFEDKYFKNNKDAYAVCISFKKLKINTESLYAEPTKKIQVIKLPRHLPRILQNTEVYIERLLNANLKGEKIFKTKDSINFAEQNNCFLKYTIPKKIAGKIKTIPVSKIENATDYMIFSIPIFSEDNKKAYMEIDCYAKELPYGESVYLEKKDNVWKVIDNKTIWVKCQG